MSIVLMPIPHWNNQKTQIFLTAIDDICLYSVTVLLKYPSILRNHLLSRLENTKNSKYYMAVIGKYNRDTHH